MQKTLVYLAGPTASGKTRLSIELAKILGTEIVSCDSRQMYREMTIGTAKPTKEELQEVKHHFVDFISVHDYYSCGRFEIEAMRVLDDLFKTHDHVVLTGGSMLYADALCNGIDDRPDVDERLRQSLWDKYYAEGLDPLVTQLEELDPEYAATMDRHNYKRIIHAIEICLTSRQKYSLLRKNEAKERPFGVMRIGIDMPREELYGRINARVDNMVADGLLEEVAALMKINGYRELNALNTVGYRELFDHFEGRTELQTAIDQIKRNTRHYAKKQMTWFGRYEDMAWIDGRDPQTALEAAKKIIEEQSQ